MDSKTTTGRSFNQRLIVTNQSQNRNKIRPAPPKNKDSDG